MHHLVFLVVSNSTTTNVVDSVPPREKAQDVLLFLDCGILQLEVTQVALEALHYRAFSTFFYGHPLAQCTPGMM